MVQELDRIKNNNTGDEFRVLSVFDGNIITCRLNIKKLDVVYFTEESIEKGIDNNVYTIESDKFSIFDSDIFFKNDTKGKREKYEKYKKVCSAVYDEYRYKLFELTRFRTTKPLVKKLCTDYNLPRQMFWKYFTRYLQSGLQDISLVDQRGLKKKSHENRTVSAGRKKRNGDSAFLLQKDDIKYFKKILDRYLKSQTMSKENAYLDLIDEFYSVEVSTVNEEGVKEYIRHKKSKFPSRRQFFYYIDNNSTKKQRKEAKQTKPVVRNNLRAFTGMASDGAKGPGYIVEMDAQEMDIALVSDEYTNIPVGRPILYIMIDVLTHMIIGVSLAMDNNSIVGCTSCFMNLLEDKNEVLKRYDMDNFTFGKGITIDDVWPSMVKPNTLKFDNGAEFSSNRIAHMTKELGINVDYAPPATGSFKPLAENFFKLIKNSIDDILEGKGLIRNVYNSKHHQNACLTYYDVYKIVLNVILHHNTQVMKNFKKSVEMKEKNIIASPMELWKYFNSVAMPANHFANRDDALYHMLIPCKDARISRGGIIRKGLTYFNSVDKELNEEMFNCGDKRYPFECRYDPRDMGHLYYLRNGELRKASIPSDNTVFEGYFNMSEKRFDELEEMRKDVAVVEDDMLLDSKLSRRRSVKLIKKNALIRKTGKNLKTPIKVARKYEKERISGINSVDNRFNIDPEKPQIVDTNEKTQEIKPEIKPQETIEERLERLRDEAAKMDEESR